MSLILSGTDGLSDVDGSAATPAIRGTDANTGIFFPAADTIAFAEGGAEVARFNSSGNFGLGATPSSWGAGTSVIDLATSGNAGAVSASGTLSIANNGFFNGTDWIYKNTSSALLYQLISNQHRWSIAPSGTAGNAITFTQAMTLDASGNLAIGSTSATAKLHVYGANTASAYAQTALIQENIYPNSAFPSMAFQTWAGGNAYKSAVGGNGTDLCFYTSSTYGVDPTERARIDSSGNLLVGKTSTSDTVIGTIQQSTGRIASAMAATVNGIDTLTCYSTGAAAYRFYVGMGGTVYATNTTISSLSDQRHKENIRNLNVGLAEVMALKPRLFDWKEGKGADIKNARGFIAQEFEEVFPDLIDEWKDPAPEGEEPYKSVRQDLIPVLVKAIQEQQALIQTLTARITALESA